MESLRVGWIQFLLDFDLCYIISKTMISDELQECRSSFSGRKNHFEVRIWLQGDLRARSLHLQLRNEQNMEHYLLVLDQTSITNHPEMSFCFETPQDLFYTLMELFEEVSVTEQGVVIFQMKLNATKLKKKVFKLQTIRQHVDQKDQLRLKLECVKRDMNSELAVRDDRINTLMRRSQLQQETINQLREEIKQLKKEQENLYLENKKEDFKINGLSKDQEHHRLEILIMKKNLDEFHKKFTTLEFYSFFENPHWHFFSIIKQPNTVRIIKKDDDNSWASFIRNLPLQPGKISQFKIRQIKACYRNIMIGVATRQAFGLINAYKDKESLAYNSYSGNVWENGSSRKGGPAIHDGQTITIDVNLLNFKVSWALEGKKIAQSNMSQSFKHKQIFLFLQFYNVNDELELSLS